MNRVLDLRKTLERKPRLRKATLKTCTKFNIRTFSSAQTGASSCLLCFVACRAQSHYCMCCTDAYNWKDSSRQKSLQTRKDKISCSRSKKESEILPGCSGNGYQLRTLNCSQLLVEGLLERCIMLHASLPCTYHHAAHRAYCFMAVKSLVLCVSCYLSQRCRLHNTWSACSAVCNAGEAMSAKDKWQGVCHEEAKEDRNGQEGPGTGMQQQHLHSHLLMLLSGLTNLCNMGLSQRKAA